MNIAGLIFLLIAHYLSGKGCLRLLKVDLKPIPFFFLSVIVGVPLISLAPCILQLLTIPIETTSVYIAVAVITALFSIPLLKSLKKPGYSFTMPLIYEWPFFGVFLLLMSISIWRCYYYPPYARDMLSGPELLAEFAVREKTMLSSVFTVELASTNNYFKSPFITSLQIIYKLMVSPMGDMWLSVIAVSFMGWLYTLLRERVHPIIAGTLLLLFYIMPDMYAYTYIILYDYTNMVFFFCGFCFLIKYVNSDRIQDMVCAAFLFGLATYIRTETLVFITMLLPIPAVYLFKKRAPLKKTALSIGVFLLVPLAFYILCMDVFVRNFVPFSFDTASQIRSNLSDFSPFFSRLKEMNTMLIFSEYGLEIYGYFIFLFCALVITDLVLYRKYNREAVMVLYGIAVIYFGLALLGYLIPLVDLMNTTKRGLFKALPLMLLYMVNSPSVQYVSEKIKKWEVSVPQEQPAPVVKPVPKAKPKKK